MFSLEEMHDTALSTDIYLYWGVVLGADVLIMRMSNVVLR